MNEENQNDQYLAMLPDAQIPNVNKDPVDFTPDVFYGAVFFTKDRFIFAHDKSFRSIGVFGAVGAPILGLAVGATSFVSDAIRSSVKKPEQPWPSKEKLLSSKHSFEQPYSEILTLTVEPASGFFDSRILVNYSFKAQCVQTVFFKKKEVETIMSINIYFALPKEIQKNIKSRQIEKQKARAEYAEFIQKTFESCMTNK